MENIAQKITTAITPLSRIGLSARALNLCESLGCKTVRNLVDVFRLNGASFVMNRPKCGKKTFEELSEVVNKFLQPCIEPKFAFVDAIDEDHDEVSSSLTNERSCFTPEQLVEDITRLQIPCELPIDFVKLPTRIKNWCKSQEWNTLGMLLQNAGGMTLYDFLAVENIGRNSATEVIAFFEAIRAGRLEDLQSFLPLMPNTSIASRNKSTEAGPCTLEFHEDHDGCTEAPSKYSFIFTADKLVEAIERLQIPYGLPIEFIRIPIRIRNWCKSQEWNTLGALLSNAGGMTLNDFLALKNIGRKSATEVIDFFEILKTQRPADLRRFLPLKPNTTLISLPEAVEDVVTALDIREVRMLEMRIVERCRLEAIARNFGCTRESVRQVEDRFLHDVERIFTWFSDSYVEFWKAWESADNLATVLHEQQVVRNTDLIALALSTVFESTPEGQLLVNHWQERFRYLGRELMSSERLFSDGIDLTEFTREQGCHELVIRFQFWLEHNFSSGLSISNGRAVRSSGELTEEESRLLYGGEKHEFRWNTQYEKLKRYRAEYGNVDVPSKWKNDPQLAVWVTNQRGRKKKGAMSTEESALLDELGFTWSLRQVGSWEDQLAEVMAFKASHGHCDIPTVFPENPKLGRFVNSTRTQRKRGVLSAERVAKLEAIGFSWKSKEKRALSGLTRS